MTDNNRKGSVIVMVVGLLVLLAMIGTTFIIVAHMDRRESASIATAAPMKQVAGGVLQQIRAKLVEDLHIDATGVIYGSAANYKQQVDFPHEDYDKHLASFAPVGVSPVWLHLSNPTGDLGEAGNHIGTDGVIGIGANASQNITTLNDAGGNPYGWVDTDGDDVKDAIAYFSGVTNRSGQKYYVAVRVIDASSLMNANSAYSTSAAAGGTVMPITNISLEALTDTTTRGKVHAARCGNTGIETIPDPVGIADYNTRYVIRPLNPNPPVNTAFLPFDASDMLALVWGGSVPNTGTGRLYEDLGTYAQSPNDRRPFLTVFSASRDYIRQVPGGVNEPLPNNRRVDMNTASFGDLCDAFYNAIPRNVPGFSPGDPGRWAVAAQLAVNVIDYHDGDDNVTVETVPGPGPAVKVFGIERQPFITEAWLRMEWVGGAGGRLEQWSAIELFNPYKTAVSLAGYKLKVGVNPAAAIPGLPANIPAGGRIVIVSNSADIQAANKYQDANLDLRKTCTLFRTVSAVDSTPVPVGLIDGLGEFGLTAPSGPVDPPVFTALRRDDAVARAKYSVAVYKTYNTVTYYTGDATCPTAALTNLGRSNVDTTVGGEATVTTTPAAVPTPVFVRNGGLINLGEASRIFYVGPQSDGTPLDNVLASLAPNDKSNGRLYTFGDIRPGGWANAYTPDIPPICMLGDYMDVLTSDPNNTGRTDTVYGRININTAPWQVIRHLPGIGTDLIAKDIVAYRDLLNNPGGTDYSVVGARAAILTDLREDAGFASPGEIAIPLAKIVTLPNDTYGASAPNCYAIADGGTSDDGLDGITGDLSKYDIYYSWLSNQLTVRSDVYIAYIRVQIGSDPATTGAVRKYVAVIDRSNCTSTTHLPNVVMFAEMK